MQQPACPGLVRFSKVQRYIGSSLLWITFTCPCSLPSRPRLSYVWLFLALEPLLCRRLVAAVWLPAPPIAMEGVASSPRQDRSAFYENRTVNGEGEVLTGWTEVRRDRGVDG